MRKEIFFFIAGLALTSCSMNKAPEINEQDRLGSYLYSKDTLVSCLFADFHVAEVQPALTASELNLLDNLVDQIDPNVKHEFDNYYKAWMNTWIHPNEHQKDTELYFKLNCYRPEDQNLINFCLKQNDYIILLFFQLAARAECPYDEYLLFPTHDLYKQFSEFNACWEEVNALLESQKPNRMCNEPVIWCTRKILEVKYDYSYTSKLATLFSTHKLLLMTQ